MTQQTELQTIRTHVQGRVGWLEYDRPPVNAFDWPMLRAVPEALQRLLADGRVRVIAIASALERHFSVGADLAVFDGVGPEGMGQWVDVCHDLVRLMRGSPKPLLAALHGTAVGGGLEITLHCDLRFADPDARLGQPEVRIGFIPPVGATQALARLMGRSRALRMLYEGGTLSAEEARAAGLVDIVAAPGRLREEVQIYGDTLARRPPEALAAIRRCVVEGGARSFAAGLAIERAEAVRLAGTRNFAEGVRAFLEKRDPVFE